MVRDRIKEVLDFATTESPYRSANKGWVNEDIYIEFGQSTEQVANEDNELVDISVYWNPLNQIVSILFVVFVLATVFVYSTISVAKGKFNFTTSSTVAAIQQITPDESPNKTSSNKLALEPNDSASIEKQPSIQANVESQGSIKESNPNISKNLSITEKPEILLKETPLKSSNNKVIANATNARNSLKEKKMVTAVDLFQPKHL